MTTRYFLSLSLLRVSDQKTKTREREREHKRKRRLETLRDVSKSSASLSLSRARALRLYKFEDFFPETSVYDSLGFFINPKRPFVLGKRFFRCLSLCAFKRSVIHTRTEKKNERRKNEHPFSRDDRRAKTVLAKRVAERRENEKRREEGEDSENNRRRF